MDSHYYLGHCFGYNEISTKFHSQGVLVIPIISRKQYLMQRFLFFAIPTSVVIFSLLISIFAGSIGPLNENGKKMGEISLKFQRWK